MRRGDSNARQIAGIEAGSQSDLPLEGRLIGTLARTRSHIKPVYVSIGHNICLEAAVELVLTSCRVYHLPEPTMLALAGNRLWLHAKQGETEIAQ